MYDICVERRTKFNGLLMSIAVNIQCELLSLYEAEVPQHTYSGAGKERMYSSYSFTTSSLDGGEWSASLPGRALPPGKDPWYPFYRRLGGPQRGPDTDV
jgi:hypothetical protein